MRGSRQQVDKDLLNVQLSPWLSFLSFSRLGSSSGKKYAREAHYTSLWIWFIVQTPLFQVFRLLYPPSFIICMCTWGIYTEENVLFIEDLVFGKEMDLFTTLDTKVNKKCLEVEQTVRTVANDLLFLSRLQYTFLTYSYRVFWILKDVFANFDHGRHMLLML